MSSQNISFSEFRECYRLYFSYILEESITEGAFLRGPETIERYLVEHQIAVFEPLVNPDAKRFKQFKAHAKRILAKETDYRYDVYANVNLEIIDKVRETHLTKSRPGMVGCHYRSIGLDDLRNSKYHAMAPYWETLEKAHPTYENTPGFTKEKHYAKLLDTYFDLFNKPKTINQQIFNTNHPLGPIGIVFVNETGSHADHLEDRPSTLHLEKFQDSDGNDSFNLVRELQESLAYGSNKRLGFLPYVLSEPRKGDEWDDYVERIKENRKKILKRIEDNADKYEGWIDEIYGFFRRRLPRNDLSENFGDILEMLQSYCVYGSLAGWCVYTFPMTMQPDLPTCGLTLMTQYPLTGNSLEFLQHASEMIYGDLFGNTILQQYRRSFRNNLYGSMRSSATPMTLLADENANLVLTATLADTPIPIKAVNTFLALASKLPQVSIYENKSYAYFMILVHQDFLESFLDRLKMNILRRSKTSGDEPDIVRPEDPGWNREVHEFLYGTEIAIELASHGMRIGVGEREAPEHTLFFVYPPFDPKIINFPGYLLKDRENEVIGVAGNDPATADTPQKSVKEVFPVADFAKLVKEHEDAMREREAVILSDIVPTRYLMASQRLKHIYARHFNAKLGPETDLDSLAEALTFGNHEILALIYERNKEMKLYHGGTLLLQSRLSRWALPMKQGDDFLEILRDRCDDLLGTSEWGRSLSQGLIRFLTQCSRRRKGVFLVFHPDGKPNEWQPLDIGRRENPVELTWLIEEGLDQYQGRLWGPLRSFAISDGAIVFCYKKGERSLSIYPKVHIVHTLHNKMKKTLHRDVLYMKGVQAREEYPELRSFGTKHSAAYEYVLMNRKGFAVVVSEDGPITLFYPEKIEQPSNYREMVPLGWEWRVEIVRM